MWKSVLTWLVCVLEKACIWVGNKRRKKKKLCLKLSNENHGTILKMCILLAVLLLHFPFDKKSRWWKPVKLGRKGTSWSLATKFSYVVTWRAWLCCDTNFFAPFGIKSFCLIKIDSLKSDCNLSGDGDMCEHVSVAFLHCRNLILQMGHHMKHIKPYLKAYQQQSWEG